MFDRAGIKTWAKGRLMGEHRWMAVLVTFLAGLLGAAGVSSNIQVSPDGNGRVNIELPGGETVLSGVLLLGVLVGLLLAIAYTIFLGNVLTVGFDGWMLRFARGENPPVGELFSSFRIYVSAMATMLQRDVYAFLWSLLFLIPGIVKGYAYSMTPYIIYDNPRLTPDEAITLSRKMTYGYKLELFVMDLSFIGWHLLSGLTLGILGIVYVDPYMHLSKAGAYEWLRNNALQTGRVTWQELYGNLQREG